MKTKLLMASAAALALTGGVAATFDPPEAGAPFLDPRLLAASMCGVTDEISSRRAFFFQIAAAQELDGGLGAAGLLPSATLDVVSRNISTASREAQNWFNQGLAHTFNFNHDAAILAFRKAQSADPGCAMCYWGEAFAWGPNINAPMVADAYAPAYLAAAKAKERRDTANTVEQALIDAIAVRYTIDPPADRSSLDAAFADKMEEASRAFPQDDLVAVIAAEANMDTQAWAYWDALGREPVGRTARTIELLEGVLERNPDYPPAIHLYIHITEASTDPFRAAKHADRLADLTPELGHLVHMPSHTYYRIGRWRQSLDHNLEAVGADMVFLATHEASPLYEYGYFTHNIHFAMTSAQMGGDGTTALEMAALLDEKLPIEMASTQAWVQPIKAAPYYAQAQFGDPEETIALPDPGEAMPFLQGAWRYARGDALVQLGRVDEARAEAAAIKALIDEADLSALEDGGVPASGVLDVARHTVLARAAAAEGDYDTAIDLMESAVALQEGFAYTEPPYWYYPAKQTLAAMVLQSGEAERAEQLFLETLVDSPNNAYAFYGLHMAYDAQGERRGRKFARALYKEAWLGERRDRPELSRL